METVKKPSLKKFVPYTLGLSFWLGMAWHAKQKLVVCGESSSIAFIALY